MEVPVKTSLFEWPPDAIPSIRKIHNLDTPGRLEEAINIFEEWIKKQDHFVKKDFSREYLEKCIVANKGSVEKAKTQLDSLCTLKTLMPHFFTMHNLKTDFNVILDNQLLSVFPLPKMTDDFYRIYMIKLKTKEFNDKIYMAYYQFNIIISEYIRAQDYSNGFIIILDYQDVNIMDLVTSINPLEFQQFMTIIVKGFGIRIKAIHILTKSKAVDVLVKMVKPFLSQKIANRIFIHKTIKQLHAEVPQDLLPKEYEGKEKSLQDITKQWIEELSAEQNVEYIKMMSKACTNEQLRQSDKFNNEYMGMSGSFRNLKVD